MGIWVDWKREGRRGQDRQDGRRDCPLSRLSRRYRDENVLSHVDSLTRGHSPGARVALKRLRNAFSSGVTALRRHRQSRDDIPGPRGRAFTRAIFREYYATTFSRTIRLTRERMRGGSSLPLECWSLILTATGIGIGRQRSSEQCACARVTFRKP